VPSEDEDENEDEDTDTPVDELLAKIESEIMICKLLGIDPANYEAWRDSMPDERYYWLCQKISEKDFQKTLVRII